MRKHRIALAVISMVIVLFSADTSQAGKGGKGPGKVAKQARGGGAHGGGFSGKTTKRSPGPKHADRHGHAAKGGGKAHKHAKVDDRKHATADGRRTKMEHGQRGKRHAGDDFQRDRAENRARLREQDLQADLAEADDASNLEDETPRNFGERISRQARDKQGRLDADGDGVDDYRNFGERVSQQAHERNAARRRARLGDETPDDPIEETPDETVDDGLDEADDDSYADDEPMPRNFGERISRLARDKQGRLDLDGDGVDDFRNFGERVRYERSQFDAGDAEPAPEETPDVADDAEPVAEDTDD